MLYHDTQIRIRYADTDQMGHVYHGKYVEYFEVGRVEMLRHFGMPYTDIEAKGILMPVAGIDIQYKRPLHYDELITVRTIVRELPQARFVVSYELYKEGGDLAATGKVQLAFIDSERMRPTRIPAFLKDFLQQLWDSQAKA